MIASLSLAGCSGIQETINNKIASTAKEVSDGVNSEVGKATDALKSEFGTGENVNAKNLQGTLFMKYFESYSKEKKDQAMSSKFLESGSEGLKKDFGLILVKELSIDTCPPNPDGACGSNFFIFTKTSNWNKAGNQEFYLADGGGAPGDVYGPFTDDLQKLYNEIKDIKTVKFDTAAAE